MFFFNILLAYLVFILVFIAVNLLKAKPQRTLAKDQNKLRGTGISFDEKSETEDYAISHVVEDGIERITYTPKNRKHNTPILMLHGMWHGAWCWEPWQEYLTQQGWEVISFSLPGHGKSTLQRPLWLCTLDYYLAFLRDEVNHLPQKPILMGHSMGGALIQWYLKHVGDDLPAVALIAPWVAKNAFLDGLPLFTKYDPIGVLLNLIQLNANPYMRNPKVAAHALVSDNAPCNAEELHAKLDGESALVMFQHMPPFWYPPENLKTPISLAAGTADRLVSYKGLKASAEFYGAEFIHVPDAGHNLMMEKSATDTIEKINHWLEETI